MPSGYCRARRVHDESMNSPLIRSHRCRNVPCTPVLVTVAALSVSGAARTRRGPDDCSLKTLRGIYVFAATGYNIMSGVPQPKAIVEVIEFNGDGMLTCSRCDA